MLEPLTPEERARHEKGIERIRRRLFRRYLPSDYFIIPNSEEVIAACAESCWNAACGSYRVFRVGGLSFAADGGAEGQCRFSVSHMDTNRFSFWMIGARGHTITSLIVPFRDLDEMVYATLCAYRRANIAHAPKEPLL